MIIKYICAKIPFLRHIIKSSIHIYLVQFIKKMRIDIFIIIIFRELASLQGFQNINVQFSDIPKDYRFVVIFLFTPNSFEMGNNIVCLIILFRVIFLIHNKFKSSIQSIKQKVKIFMIFSQKMVVNYNFYL